ncbi:MAG TPA: 2-oxoacid:acceptor oxidoreductase family protein [Planctomycetota bacterium]|nr:2-oxoacid:acceptor oxidoreductase family protein [Planctomycetota bacterium]
MTEIRFHGRGGQGAVVAAQILAAALFREGLYVQSFPAFGMERRGAPVAAFVRFDDRPIRLRSQIYAPDHIVVLDHHLLHTAAVLTGLKPGGWVIVNCNHHDGRLGVPSDFRLAVVDASGIAAMNRLGSTSIPIVNTAILGAFAKATDLVGIDSVVSAISESVPVKAQENVHAARQAYDFTETL